MTVLVFVLSVSVVRVLMVVVGVVLVWPGMGVGVTQGAVTMHIALDQLIGGRGHGQVSVERARSGLRRTSEP